jgi:hypothetical protein
MIKLCTQAGARVLRPMDDLHDCYAIVPDVGNDDPDVCAFAVEALVRTAPDYILDCISAWQILDATPYQPNLWKQNTHVQ